MSGKGVPKFADLCKKKYADQAVWFLNGFWRAESLNGPKAEQVWDIVKKFVELDTAKGAEGNELNEFDSHRVLEKYNETLSVVKMREALREIDQDANGKMSVIEYLIWRYKKTPQQCVESPQGDNTAKIEACQRKLAEVQSALEDVQAKTAQNQQQMAQQAAAIKAQEAAIRAQQAAVAATEEAIRQLSAKEAELARAEEEAKAAVAELKAQEQAYADKISALEQKSTDTSIGLVTRNKAANELAQLKGEDPLPLRKAKITQEAAVRRVQKAQAEVAAQKLATEAKKEEQKEAERQLQVKKRELEAVQRQLEQTQRELEAAEQDLQNKMAEAEAELEAAKAEGGESHGNFWWMGRQLYQADESLARAKQKYDHTKPFNYSE